MSLQGLLHGLRPRDLVSTAHPSAPRELEAASGELAEMFSSSADLPEHEDIDALESRIRHALDRNTSHMLARRDWRMLPHTLWYRNPPLISHPRLLTALRARLQQGGSLRLLRNLLSAYLTAFHPRLPGLVEIAKVIDDHRGILDDVWHNRVKDYGLTQPDKAPSTIFLACIRADRPEDALQVAGIVPEVHHGILHATLLAGIAAIERDFVGGGWHPKAMDFVERQVFADDAPVAPELRRALADAYLRPWLNGDPSDSAQKKRIQDFMLRHYGDPRIRPQRWTGVSDPARSVMRRWLVKVVLDQFLDVIDDVVKDEAHRRQWKYRRAFWLAYFNREAIIEADVLFGPDCLSRTKQLFGRDAPCASVEGVPGRQVYSDHAVLLMRIGRLVVADWSHNACWCVWRETDRSAPRFGQARYLGDDVYRERGRWSRPHSNPSGYTWQDELRDLIHTETGIFVDRQYYTVR
jgi:hypothetical protein